MDKLNIIKYISTISNKNINNDELIAAIEEAKLELECARINFEFAEDFNLIDAAIFSEAAAKKKYDYYISIAKKRGIRATKEYILNHCINIAK